MNHSTNDSTNESLKHKDLIKAKLGYTTIKEFRDELTSLKTILNENNNLKLLRELQTKRKLNMLDDNLSDTLEE